MKDIVSKSAIILGTLLIFSGGCVVAPEHRMDVAASRDDARRSEFEHCRAEGRADCAAILNAPVDSDTQRGDAVRERERRAAYDRCVARGGSDCDDLLHRDDYPLDH
jgi:hypothetical protein